MPARDEWGHDPTVQMMRRIFSLMEKSQGDLLKRLNLSPFDSRLRRARSSARDLFEQAWPIALQKGIVSNDRGAALLYMHCLVYALDKNRVSVPDQIWPKDDRIAAFLKENLK
jgi:hypothetical protein